MAILGGSVLWALTVWEKVENIRKARAETAKTDSFSQKEIKSFFDEKIESTVRAEIDRRVDELVPVAEGQRGRKHEQRTDIAWALEAILSRVERGMVVEVRMLPPAKSEGSEDESDDDGESGGGAYEEIRAIEQMLEFPPAAAKPILALTKAPENEKESKPKKPRRS